MVSSATAPAISPSTISIARGMFSLSPEIEIVLWLLPAPIENEQAMSYISEAICSAVMDPVPR
ncbi:unknown [Alistipes sp. CAG:268]|nr:unknown [Alistipes sp. CAG:268]